MLLPALGGLFGIANLLDIYATTSELPPQRELELLSGPLVVHAFYPLAQGLQWEYSGMTAAQATVLVSGRHATAIQGKEGLDLTGKHED